ncbi:MAG: helix-turn-helix domain-containing protein [Armatimonadota bacterium]
MLKVGRVTLISMSEAVKEFGISKETLRRAIRRKQLRAFSAGRRTYLKPEDVRRWKERYYHPFRADAVRVRWAKQKTRGRAKTKKAA